MPLKRILKTVLFAGMAVILFAVIPAAFFFLSYYNSLKSEVVARFSQKRWNIPSRIYSDSAVLYPGQSLKDTGFFERLARLNYHRIESGRVSERGEYSYDPKHGRLTIFLRNFAYPYRNFGGEIVQMDLMGRNQTIESMSDPESERQAPH